MEVCLKEKVGSGIFVRNGKMVGRFYWGERGQGGDEGRVFDMETPPNEGIGRMTHP